MGRPTLYELKGRFGEEAGDIQLGMLQAIANRGYADRSEIEVNVYRSAYTAHQVGDALLADALADSAMEERGDQNVEVVFLTDTGVRLLEQWTFANYEVDDESASESEAGRNDRASPPVPVSLRARTVGEQARPCSPPGSLDTLGRAHGRRGDAVANDRRPSRLPRQPGRSMD